VNPKKSSLPPFNSVSFVPPHSLGPHGNPAAAHTIFIRVQWRCSPGLGGWFHRQLLAFPCTLTLSLHGFSLSMNKLFPFLERNIADSLPSLLAYIFLSQTLFCGYKQIWLYFILFLSLFKNPRSVLNSNINDSN
jgi:hypothetical protein